MKTIAKNWNTKLFIWDDTVGYASCEVFLWMLQFPRKKCSLRNHGGVTKSHCCDSQTVANDFIGNTVVTFGGILPMYVMW